LSEAEKKFAALSKHTRSLMKEKGQLEALLQVSGGLSALLVVCSNTHKSQEANENLQKRAEEICSLKSLLEEKDKVRRCAV
jgi:hypothetical protein